MSQTPFGAQTMHKRESEDLMSEFKKGEVIKVKAEYLKKRRKKGTFTPADLIAIGWPNRFQVVGVGKDGEGEPVISLDPCCSWMVEKTEKKEKKEKDYLCWAHRAERFEAVPETKTHSPSSDPSSNTIRSTVGNLFRVDYSDDDEPCLEIQVGEGEPLILGGKIGKAIGEKFKNAGLL